jgi:hypothetical protein
LTSSGTREFLDFGGDYAKFVWRVVELFPSVEKIEIEIGQKRQLLALGIFRCLLTDKWIDWEEEPDDTAKAWSALKGTGNDGEECIWLEERLVVGEPRRRVRRRVRRVEVTCKHSSVIGSF